MTEQTLKDRITLLENWLKKTDLCTCGHNWGEHYLEWQQGDESCQIKFCEMDECDCKQYQHVLDSLPALETAVKYPQVQSFINSATSEFNKHLTDIINWLLVDPKNRAIELYSGEDYDLCALTAKLTIFDDFSKSWVHEHHQLENWKWLEVNEGVASIACYSDLPKLPEDFLIDLSSTYDSYSYFFINPKYLGE